MPQRSFIQLFVLFLGLSYVVSSSAIPTTRSLKSTQQDLSAQELLVQVEDGEGVIEKRMVVEVLDYPGSSASHQHDPKPPARN